MFEISTIGSTDIPISAVVRDKFCGMFEARLPIVPGIVPAAYLVNISVYSARICNMTENSIIIIILLLHCLITPSIHLLTSRSLTFLVPLRPTEHVWNYPATLSWIDTRMHKFTQVLDLHVLAALATAAGRTLAVLWELGQEKFDLYARF